MLSLKIPETSHIHVKNSTSLTPKPYPKPTATLAVEAEFTESQGHPVSTLFHEDEGMAVAADAAREGLENLGEDHGEGTADRDDAGANAAGGGDMRVNAGTAAEEGGAEGNDGLETEVHTMAPEIADVETTSAGILPVTSATEVRAVRSPGSLRHLVVPKPERCDRDFLDWDRLLF